MRNISKYFKKQGRKAFFDAIQYNFEESFKDEMQLWYKPKRFIKALKTKRKAYNNISLNQALRELTQTENEINNKIKIQGIVLDTKGNGLNHREWYLEEQKFNINFNKEISLSKYLAKVYGTDFVTKQGNSLFNLANINNLSNIPDNVDIDTQTYANNAINLLYSIYQHTFESTLKVIISLNQIAKIKEQITKDAKEIFSKYLLVNNKSKFADKLKEEFKEAKPKIIKILLFLLSEKKIIAISYGDFNKFLKALNNFFESKFTSQSIDYFNIKEGNIENNDKEVVKTRLSYLFPEQFLKQFE